MTIFTRAGIPALIAVTLLSGSALAQDGTPPAAVTSPAPAVPAAGAPAAPSNEVGEQLQFEIPRVGDKEQQLELISGLCAVQLKTMSPIACKCLAEQSLTALSDPQRDYLIATAVAPPVADRMLNDGRVGQQDQELIFRFISATTEGCASGTFDADKQKAAMIPASPAPAAPAIGAPVPAAPSAPASPAAPANPATPTPAPAN